MSARYMKLVKGARRGKNLAKKFRLHFLWFVLALAFLLFGSAFLVWQQEQQLQGTYMEAMWTVLFTLIGQGEFATNPRTPVGRVIVFVLSIVGVALLGVVLSEIMQRLMSSKLRELMGLSECKYKGHTIICGWNNRAPLLVREILAMEKQVSVIASERPSNLPAEGVFFVAGSPSDEAILLRAGIMSASAAIVLSDKSDGEKGDADAKSILTALAVESVNADVYSIIELINPENERYARHAKIDDILYSESMAAEIAAVCSVHAGISVFMRNILSASDDGHHFAMFEAPDSLEGHPLRDFFDQLRKDGHLPVGVVAPPEGDVKTPQSQWVSSIHPSEELNIHMPMKAVCIVRNSR